MNCSMPRLARLLVITTSLTLLAPGLCWSNPESVLLSPTRDATLFEDVMGTIASGSGPTLFVGDNRTLNTRRALLRFDPSAAMPADAVVIAVELWVHVSDAPDQTPRSVSLHRVLEDWGEGTSASAGGGGATAEPGDATWLHRFHPDLPWSVAGGDFEPASSALTMLGASGWHSWSSERLVGDVESWLEDPSSNFGWLLRGEEGTASSARGLDSRESETPDLRPYLRIEYQSCCVSTETVNWSDLKLRF